MRFSHACEDENWKRGCKDRRFQKLLVFTSLTMAFSQSISRAVKPWMSGNHSHFDAVRSMAGEKQRDVSPVPLRAHMQANPAFRKTTPPAALEFSRKLPELFNAVGNRIWWGRFRKVPKPEPVWGSSGPIRLRNYHSQRAQAQNVGHEGAIPAMPVARSDLSDSLPENCSKLRIVTLSMQVPKATRAARDFQNWTAVCRKNCKKCRTTQYPCGFVSKWLLNGYNCLKMLG